MSERDLVDYFIDQTNHKFEKLEVSIVTLSDDITNLKKYKWFLMGIASVVSIVITLGYHIMIK